MLTGIDLVVAPGERVGVTGVSGAGKSSLLHLAARLQEPTAGRVTLGGADIAGLGRGELAARVGYLTQRSELFADTVAANLRLARPDASDTALWAALATADLDGFVARLDDGLETWVGESGARLSGGQGRRLALARVVLLDPPVVLLDEPLRGLDAGGAARLRARLGPWLAGRSVLAAAHERGSTPSCDRWLTLDRGRLREP